MATNNSSFPPEDSLDFESSVFREWYDVVFSKNLTVYEPFCRALGLTREQAINLLKDINPEVYSGLYHNYTSYLQQAKKRHNDDQAL